MNSVYKLTARARCAEGGHDQQLVDISVSVPCVSICMHTAESLPDQPVTVLYTQSAPGAPYSASGSTVHNHQSMFSLSCDPLGVIPLRELKSLVALYAHMHHRIEVKLASRIGTQVTVDALDPNILRSRFRMSNI